MIYCRVEKINIRTKSGSTKIGSVLLCMAGVATLAFYKGPQIRIVHHLLFRYHHNIQQHEDQFSSGQKWILGSILLFLATIMWSLWIVIQVPTHIAYLCVVNLIPSCAIMSRIIRKYLGVTL